MLLHLACSCSISRSKRRAPKAAFICCARARHGRSQLLQHSICKNAVNKVKTSHALPARAAADAAVVAEAAAVEEVAVDKSKGSSLATHTFLAFVSQHFSTYRWRTRRNAHARSSSRGTWRRWRWRAAGWCRLRQKLRRRCCTNACR